MLIVQIGNQGSPHATEAAYRDGYRNAGCAVVGIEQATAKAEGPAWFRDQVVGELHPDLVVYSRTHNDTALGPGWTACWCQLEDAGVQTASVHLDVFWGIPERERWIEGGDPMFTTGLVLTADGGSDERWADAGVNHAWLAPGADVRFVPIAAEPFEDLAGKVVFVGSSGYHSEWPHRTEMLTWARSTFGSRFVEFGNGALRGPKRGEDLARIYASDCVVIGDSMFAGQRHHYWSDRLPETLARGGLLCMAYTEGMEERYDPGSELLCWDAGDFDTLLLSVEYLEGASPTRRAEMRSDGQIRVLRRDTYRHRALEVLDRVGLAKVTE